MNYAIMRCKKLKTMGCVAASLKHCFRERDTPNADPTRTPDNEHLSGNSRTSEAMGYLRTLLPEKRRKDAVLAVEYLCTASPEWWKTADKAAQDEFFKRAEEWLAKKYGRDNIVVATIHRDETSPHLSAFVVPLTPDGRLSAKEFIGDRKKMQDDQTTFAETMRGLGLQRGIQGSRAKHTTIREYYAKAKEPMPSMPELQYLKPGLGDRFDIHDYGKRATKYALGQFQPVLKAMEAKAIEHDRALKLAAEALKHAVESEKIANQQRERANHLNGLCSEYQKAAKIVQLFTPEEIKTAQQREREKAERHHGFTR